MDFYIDQDALGIGKLLRRAGYSVITAAELGYGRYRDEAHLLYAARNGLTLISCNGQDYEMLHRAWKLWDMMPGHAGIIIPAQRVQRNVMADLTLRFLDENPMLTNRLYRWTSGSGWQHYDVPSQLAEN